jgi:hypothetical protein
VRELNKAAMSTAVPAQAQEPTTGYAPVSGLKMYYEIMLLPRPAQ